MIEAIVQRCSIKKVFLKKALWHKCFPVNFAKFLRTPFLIKHLRWLLLTLTYRTPPVAASVMKTYYTAILVLQCSTLSVSTFTQNFFMAYFE